MTIVERTQRIIKEIQQEKGCNPVRIFKNMAGNIQSEVRTATELTYSVSGQTARLNMMLDAINRKLIIPMVEKTAEIIANFKLAV